MVGGNFPSAFFFDRTGDQPMTKHSYTAVHIRKGTLVVEGASSYDAAKAAAQQWRLKSTSGIDVYRNDTAHTFA
jgi:hypothetical protein